MIEKIKYRLFFILIILIITNIAIGGNITIKYQNEPAYYEDGSTMEAGDNTINNVPPGIYVKAKYYPYWPDPRRDTDILPVYYTDINGQVNINAEADSYIKIYFELKLYDNTVSPVEEIAGVYSDDIDSSKVLVYESER